MNPLWSLLLSLSLLAAPGPVIPGFQQVRGEGQKAYRPYGLEEGLDSLGITGLDQDREGNIWLRADLGLYRYDGVRFRRFDRKHGLASDAPEFLWADPLGGVWVAGGEHLQRIVDDRVLGLPEGWNLPDRVPAAMGRDGQGRLWVGLIRTGFFLETRTGHFEKVSEIARPQTLAIAPKHGGTFLFGIEGRVELLRPGQPPQVWGADSGLGSVSAISALEDAQGRLWVLDAEKLSYKDLDSSRFIPFRHPIVGPGGQTRNLAPDGNGGIWVATAAGLLNVRGNQWRTPTSAEGLPALTATAALVDRSGSFWFAGGGFYRELGFGLVSNLGVKEGLPSESAWTINQDTRGRIWVGTERGLAFMENGRLHAIRGTEGLSVVSLVPEPDGSILASGSNRPDLIHFDGRTGQAVNHRLPGVDPLKDTVLRLFRRRDGSLWGLSGMDLIKIARRGSRFEVTERLPFGTGKTIAADSVVEDTQGRLWIAGGRGLSVLKEGRWSHFGMEHGLAARYLAGMSLAPDGSLFLCFRESLGVMQIAPEGDGIRIVRHLREAQGDLPTDSVFSTHIDRSGRLWLNTNIGAVLVMPGGYRVFGRAAGLFNPDMMQGAFHDDGQAGLWFGTSGGLIRLASQGPGWDLKLPSPVFSSITFGKQVRTRSEPNGVLRVQPKDNTLECSLGCLAYGLERSFTYEIRLDGLEREWRNEPVPHLRYAALPPGDYVLRVRVRWDGQVGPESTLSFRVLPRWYQTWTFRLLLVVALGPLVWGVAAWRHRRLRLMNEKLEALVHSRTQQLEEANRLLEEQTLHDPLTGLYNRRFLTFTLPEQVARIQRDIETRKGAEVLGGHPMAFLLVDVDHFKRVNDEYGHDAGDQVLVELSRRLKETVRETDTVIRWGGEEFLVVARQLGASDLSTLAERLRCSVEEEAFRLEDGRSIPLTISIGFCPFPLGNALPILAWDKAVMLADRGLYAAKRSGRNRWVGLDEGPAFDAQELASFAGHPDIPGLLERNLLHGVGSHEEVPREAWN